MQRIRKGLNAQGVHPWEAENIAASPQQDSHSCAKKQPQRCWWWPHLCALLAGHCVALLMLPWYQGQGALTQELNRALIHLCFQCQRQHDENQKMSEIKLLLSLLQTSNLHRCSGEEHRFSWIRWFPEGWELPFLAMDGFLLTCVGQSSCSLCPKSLNV